MSNADLAEAVRVIGGALAEAETTILAGWPDSYGWPTDAEAHAIESAWNELALHNIYADNDQHRWIVAGNIVARIRRDAPISR
jgi:tetrahydromethanopterin S-methyltransferase subunit H